MKKNTPNIMICGAGIAGISAAYHLVVREKIKNVLLLDQGQPLSLTTDKGTQAYRNWWPAPDDTMIRFINRSIDLLEELSKISNNIFELNRRGYVFLTSDTKKVDKWRETAQISESLGAGNFREQSKKNSYIPSPSQGWMPLDGADLITEQKTIGNLYPFISKDTIAMLHVRRAGWMNSIKLGYWLLEEFKRHGGEFINAKVVKTIIKHNSLEEVILDTGESYKPGTFVVAAGPLLKELGKMLDLEIPVSNELHGKIKFPDYLNLIPENSPLMIWDDPVYLNWTEEEKQKLLEKGEAWLTKEFPSGVHFRPNKTNGNNEIMIIWTYDTKTLETVFPPKFNKYYSEVLLRALSKMVPSLKSYFGQAEKAYIDGGYYCKTPENRPLIGSLPIKRAYLIGALSGFGLMSSQAAAELLCKYITGDTLPDYADMFSLERYQNPKYKELLTLLDSYSGQL
jgi:glycine/D-amino acid oxidase-like deaminating enzyme